MAITQISAWWFILPVLPICLYVAYTDLSRMKITNRAVGLLVIVFVVLGPFALPNFETYLWRLAQLVIILLLGMVLNALGAMGAGDSKFLAAAAPYVALGDLRLIIWLFAATLMAALITHFLTRATGLSKLAPHWESWDRDNRFPLGLALGPTLAIYLLLALFQGA